MSVGSAVLTMIFGQTSRGGQAACRIYVLTVLMVVPPSIDRTNTTEYTLPAITIKADALSRSPSYRPSFEIAYDFAASKYRSGKLDEDTPAETILLILLSTASLLRDLADAKK